MTLERALVVLLALLLGSSLMVIYVDATHLLQTQDKLKSSESNARVGWGKYYDLVEAEGKEEEAETSKLRLEIYKLQQALLACK